MLLESKSCTRFYSLPCAIKVNTETGAKKRVLPICPAPVPLLVLQLDQGQIGCAGVAFAMYHLKLMVYARFDKIHRLIRDLKLAENGCCKKIFTKTKLQYAYLASVNKRPFGTSAFAMEKKNGWNTSHKITMLSLLFF